MITDDCQWIVQIREGVLGSSNDWGNDYEWLARKEELW